MCAHTHAHTHPNTHAYMHQLDDYLEPQLLLIVYSPFLPFFCCSLIHFSSAHRGCVSGATGTASTALCKDIVLLSCAETAQTHTKKLSDAWENTLVFTQTHTHTHKPSSRVNEALELLKVPPARDGLCFIHPLIPIVLPSFLTSSCQFCTWVLFLVATLHLNLLTDQS